MQWWQAVFLSSFFVQKNNNNLVQFLQKKQEFFRSKNSYFLQIELQVIAIVLLIAVAVQAENCQVAGTPLFSYFSIGFEFSISNISRKKSWFLLKLQLSF